MKQVPCQAPGCSQNIIQKTIVPKYCLEHQVIELICDKCGITFSRKRTIHEHLRASAERQERVFAPCCSKPCASQRLRPQLKGVPKGSYQHKQSEPDHPLDQPGQNVDFVGSRECNFIPPERQWNFKHSSPVTVTDEDFYDLSCPVNECRSFREGTLVLTVLDFQAITARMNNPEYRQRAAWKQPEVKMF